MRTRVENRVNIVQLYLYICGDFQDREALSEYLAGSDDNSGISDAGLPCARPLLPSQPQSMIVFIYSFILTVAGRTLLKCASGGSTAFNM